MRPEQDLITVTPLGPELRDLRESFLSQLAVQRFLGYMHSQHERMLGGGRRSRVPNRPELIEKHGWDVKYGSHALRLAFQGHEIARDEVSQQITAIERDIRDRLDTGATPLPATADVQRISAWAIDAQRRHWNWT